VLTFPFPEIPVVGHDNIAGPNAGMVKDSAAFIPEPIIGVIPGVGENFADTATILVGAIARNSPGIVGVVIMVIP